MVKKITTQLKDIPEGYRINDQEEKIIQQILSMKPLPTLLTFEFNNVYTGGKKMKQDPEMPKRMAEFASLGCDYHQLERGGQVTWHGNGQMTAYVILDIKGFDNLSVRCFVDLVLLKAAQNVLKKHYNIDSFNDSTNPGLWTKQNPCDGKIVSIGTHIQRAITSYGIGFNVNNDLKYLNLFEMCGLSNVQATSVKNEIPLATISVEEVAKEYSQQLALALGINQVDHIDGKEVLELLQ